MTNMIPPTKDRSYYNMMDDEELVHFVRYPQLDRTDWRELAIVLAERLHDATRKLEGIHYDQLSTRTY